jgi:hypothetical protein
MSWTRRKALGWDFVCAPACLSFLLQSSLQYLIDRDLRCDRHEAKVVSVVESRTT